MPTPSARRESLLDATLVALILACVLLFSWLTPRPVAGEEVQQMQLPPEIRAWFRNPDGSCVQCSIGMVGVHANNLNAATLLWDTPFGERERGGSTPARVAAYCNERHLEAWNVTGQVTWDWMKWACRTGRFAAIGAGTAHFQTLYGWDPQKRVWYVCNNNSTQRVDEYTPAQFERLHLASGQWVVVLKNSTPVHPVYHAWWLD